MNSLHPTIGVVGLGYIGLPTAAMFAMHGAQVLGIDVNQNVVDTINRGAIHIVLSLKDLWDEIVREGYDPAYGARPLRRTVQRRIENELARRILSGEVESGQKVTVDFADAEYRFSAVMAVLEGEIVVEAA